MSGGLAWLAQLVSSAYRVLPGVARRKAYLPRADSFSINTTPYILVDLLGFWTRIREPGTR